MNTQCSLPDFFLPHRFIFPAPNENILNIFFLRKYLQAICFIQYLCFLLSPALIFFFAMLFGEKKNINFIELSHSRYKTKTNKLSLFSVRIHCSDVSLRRKKKKVSTSFQKLYLLHSLVSGIDTNLRCICLGMNISPLMFPKTLLILTNMKQKQCLSKISFHFHFQSALLSQTWSKGQNDFLISKCPITRA